MLLLSKIDRSIPTLVCPRPYGGVLKVRERARLTLRGLTPLVHSRTFCFHLLHFVRLLLPFVLLLDAPTLVVIDGVVALS